MSATKYPQDSGVEFTAAFARQDNGVPFDPTGTITARVAAPDGTTQSYVYGVAPELIKVSTGVYVLTITLSLSGLWAVHVWCTGSAPNDAVGAAAADDRVVAIPAAA